jgi:ATP-binding cassette subfamily B protein
VDALTLPAIDLSRIIQLAVIIAALGICSALMVQLVAFWRSQISRASSLESQQRLFEAADRQGGLAFFEDPDRQNELQIARSVGVTSGSQCVEGCVSVAQALVTVMSFAVALTVYGPFLPLMVIVSGLVPALATELYLGRRRLVTMQMLAESQRREVFYSGLLTDPRAAKEARLFGTGPYLRRLMRAETRRINKEHRRLDVRVIGLQTGVQVLSATVAGVVVVWGAHSVAQHLMTVGGLTLAISAVASTQAALLTLVSGVAEVHESGMAFRAFDSICQRPPDLTVACEPVEVPEGRTIEFDRVWFRYHVDGEWILKDVSFTLRAGETHVLVGMNGAGKSTITSLLCRFYDPERGAIRWNGINITEFDPSHLRARIRAVFQEPVWYDLTVADNIGLGAIAEHQRGTLDHVRPACLAGADTFIDRMPQAYSTMLGSVFAGPDHTQGTQLSGGQWQRLGIARGLAHPTPDLLILDEVNSALDAIAEARIYLAVRATNPGGLRVIVTHRLAWISPDDIVMVLEDGEIAESGRPAELLRSGGRYAELYETQAAGFAHQAAG